MEFLLEALLESLQLLPFFIIIYLLIETIEVISANKIKNPKFFTGRWSTALGATCGLIPMCGFSVVATDLYSDKKIKMGTLLAVYIATSDEAIPLLLLEPSKVLSILPLLAIKFIVAIVIGYSVNLIIHAIQKKTISKNVSTSLESNSESNATTEIEELHDHKEETHVNEQDNKESDSHHHGCCGHDIDTDENKKFNVKAFFLHPIIHSLKIFAFVLVANIILGGLMEWIGQNKLQSFLSSSFWFAPLISSLIGLIPNCASSFAITQLFIDGGLSFGACVGGLIVNAGIALLVLFKQNKNIKQNLTIFSIMISVGTIVGYIIQIIEYLCF